MADFIFFLILAILIFSYLLERVLSYLNIKNMSPELPKEAEGIYDEEKYKVSQNYQKESSRFGLISSTFSFLLILLMLIFGGFGLVDQWVRGFSDNPIAIALIFFGVLALASDIISLPFELYDTFVIEEKFGFNKTTPKTFILDKVKGYLLGAIVGGGLLALITWIYLAAGPLFWLYIWAVVSAFTLLAGMFYASVILPIFNKLTPLENGPLRSAIEDYAKGVDFKVDNIYIMDGSKRSSKANAFFSGLGPNKKIVLFDTLIEKHTTEELVAVLAHEVGHYKKKHTLQGILLSLLQTGIMLYILSLLIESPALALALGAMEPSFHIGILAFSLLYSPIGLVFGIIMNIVSRKNEYEADDFAKHTYKSSPLISALKKLSVDNLSNLSPHPAYVFFHYSHPPLLKRIDNLKK
ncbi:MAG: M48 family metallopeptidase [Bacteroidetes bacterium]|nr:M48 family metallopeptidase [Bacteroidota bacterium]